uniref:Uncharacterized protein n=1 Tax=Anguilla anguilla TaxID=7936 RepID=A0A0E9WSA0_ANGAN
MSDSFLLLVASPSVKTRDRFCVLLADIDPSFGSVPCTSFSGKRLNIVMMLGHNELDSVWLNYALTVIRLVRSLAV